MGRKERLSQAAKPLGTVAGWKEGEGKKGDKGMDGRKEGWKEGVQGRGWKEGGERKGGALFWPTPLF